MTPHNKALKSNNNLQRLTTNPEFAFFFSLRYSLALLPFLAPAQQKPHSNKFRLWLQTHPTSPLFFYTYCPGGGGGKVRVNPDG